MTSDESITPPFPPSLLEKAKRTLTKPFIGVLTGAALNFAFPAKAYALPFGESICLSSAIVGIIFVSILVWAGSHTDARPR